LCPAAMWRIERVVAALAAIAIPQVS